MDGTVLNYAQVYLLILVLPWWVIFIFEEWGVSSNGSILLEGLGICHLPLLEVVYQVQEESVLSTLGIVLGTKYLAENSPVHRVLFSDLGENKE